MVVSTMTRPGQTNGTGNTNSLFLRLFAGEVLTEFHRKNIFMPYHRVRTISGGKSATFPVTGTATAKYHTAGESVYGTDNSQSSTYLSNIKVKEREIFVDDPIVSGVFTPTIDELKNHWDHRSIFTAEIGTALAEKADNNIVRTILAAAKAAPSFNPMTTTEKKIVIADATVGANIADFAFQAAQLFDTYNIPKEGRILALRPKQYYALAGETDLVNRDWTAGRGDYAQAKIMEVAGFTIVMSTAIGTTDETGTSATGEKNDPFGAGEGYAADWTDVGALAFQTGAAGTVKMRELSVETEQSIERRGHLILASYIMGHGILRPECAAWMQSTTI